MCSEFPPPLEAVTAIETLAAEQGLLEGESLPSLEKLRSPSLPSASRSAGCLTLPHAPGSVRTKGRAAAAEAVSEEKESSVSIRFS